jgi:hypothetical protein
MIEKDFVAMLKLDKAVFTNVSSKTKCRMI